MKRIRFWGVLAALLSVLLLLGACGELRPVQSLLYGMGRTGGAGAFREPQGVEYTVCRIAYEGLSPVQRQAYRAVYNSVTAHPDRIALPVMSEDALCEVMQVFQLENPHILCMKEDFSYRISGQVLFLYPQYRESRTACEIRTAALLEKAGTLAAEAAAAEDAFGTELYLHDALCGCCAYGDGTWADTAYGALIEGEARCGGYTAAMKLLLDMCGFSGTSVRGEVKTADAQEMHVWNAVALDGVWYYTDVTWDDPSGVRECRHDYFNVSEKELARTHSGYTLPSGMRIPGGSGDYFVHSGYYCTGQNWRSVLRNAVAAAVSGDGSLEVKFASAALLREVKAALFERGMLEELARPYAHGAQLACSYSVSEDMRVLHVSLGV